MLISEEYRRLNVDLHAKSNYGKGGHRWAEQIATIISGNSINSILDYGCGQGTLKVALCNLDIISEYDPAIPGKAAEPERSDLVVCTDVLEHIEPDCLDTVLNHLQKLTLRQAFFVISTRPAHKTLADGRNAHLIVETPDWWRNKIEKKFRIDNWSLGKDEIVMILAPRLEIGSIHSKSAVSDDIRYRQAKRNIKKVANRIGAQEKRIGHVILCAYGPSLTSDWESIAAEKAAFPGSVIVSVSGAHDLLISKGVIPDFHIEVDPRIHKAMFTRNSHPDVHYLIASCCHPKLVDQLVERKRRLSLFHVYNGELDLKIIDELEPGSDMVAGGGSVGLRALNLMYGIGYRSFSVRGMDSSFDDDRGGQHAGPHSGKVQSTIDVECGGKWFKTSMIMVAYARYFFTNYQTLQNVSRNSGEEPINEYGDYISMVIHGDGLLSAMATRIMVENPLPPDPPDDYREDAA